MAYLPDFMIKREVKEGRIIIDPYNENDVGQNSVDMHLGPFLKTYRDHALDVRKDPESINFIIPEEGLELHPGRLYLGSTWQRAGSDFYVPSIDGTSTVGRYGIVVHQTASKGSVGFKANWTLEISVQQPITIYAGMKIAQVYFEQILSQPENLYEGDYANQTAEPPVPKNLMRPGKFLPYKTFAEVIEKSKKVRKIA
ncbi:MAG: dCTP deaminase [Nanoarchaeota archaeon]|nr:dCTP deaminase [Nanoarchaeota archaeon]